MCAASHSVDVGWICSAPLPCTTAALVPVHTVVPGTSILPNIYRDRVYIYQYKTKGAPASVGLRKQLS